MSDEATGTGKARIAIRTVILMALMTPLTGGLIVFAVALAIFGNQVPAAELFTVVMAFAFAAGLLPAIAVGLAIASADRHGGASWRLVLVAGLLGGLVFAAVLVAVNEGGLRFQLAAGAVAVAVLSVFIAWSWVRALQARASRAGSPD
ncbi:MAG: hypothetical protein KDK07_17920 [Bauldia sp.]|nr:hypothetical protein [Bauldia sp.]